MAINEQEIEILLKTEPTHNVNADIVEKALTQMNFSEAAKKLLLNPHASETDRDTLESIALTQEHLYQVKESLGAIVDSLQDNPSLISRAAAFWGELPLWQRVVGGVVISGPTLLIGAAAHIGYLVTISGVSALAYTTSSIVLDDHHYHTKGLAEKLKAGIFGVAEVLELTIGALDAIRKKLALEVAKFKEENTKLANNVSRLSDEIESLSTQVEFFIETEKLLRETKEDLEKTVSSLKEKQEKQNALLEKTQKEAEQAKETHEKSLMQLAEKVTELAQVRVSMEGEIEKAKRITTTLEGTVKTLSGVVFNDSRQRLAFQQKLGTLFTDKSASFDQISERMSQAEQELSLVKSELKASDDYYKQLLQRQEQQICRLERLDQQEPIKKINHSKLLGTFGFMSPMQGGVPTGSQTIDTIQTSLST